MKLAHQMRWVASSALVAVLAACGGGGGGGGTGSLRLAATDAPACGYDKVNVTVEKVRVHQSGGAGEGDGGWSEIVLNPPRQIDLLSLNNGVLAELGQTALPAGTYTQMRLVLVPNRGNSAATWANTVVPTGTTAEQELTTPSGQTSGLKLPVNITVAANQLTDLVLDVDACKSIAIVTAGNSQKYLLKPVVRLIPRSLNGVAGSVDGAVAAGGATISLQKDGVVYRSTFARPDGSFLLQPVDPGTYTLVLTAPDRNTAVVKGVVVGTSTVTPVNLSSATLLGTSTVASLSGTVTTGQAEILADARALQDLSGGPRIEVISRAVHATTGEYAFSLPLAAPKVASVVAGTTTLSFSADTAVAGRYVPGAAFGLANKTQPEVDLNTGAKLADFVFP